MFLFRAFDPVSSHAGQTVRLRGSSGDWQGDGDSGGISIVTVEAGGWDGAGIFQIWCGLMASVRIPMSLIFVIESRKQSPSLSAA
jgi:hypothetical protein